MKSLFEELGGTYRREGDYFVPDLSLLSEESEIRIGKYGRMRKRFLKENRPALYANLLLSGTLTEHLAENDRSCHDRLEIIETAMMKQEGVTESLKAFDQMEWVCRCNSIRNRAEEIILTEFVNS
jgi:hypothetical protein